MLREKWKKSGGYKKKKKQKKRENLGKIVEARHRFAVRAYRGPGTLYRGTFLAKFREKPRIQVKGKATAQNKQNSIKDRCCTRIEKGDR